MLFIPVMAKMNVHLQFLQASVPHDASKMLIWCSRNIYYYQCWKLLNILVEILIFFFFFTGFFDEQSSKEYHCYWNLL